MCGVHQKHFLNQVKRHLNVLLNWISINFWETFQQNTESKFEVKFTSLNVITSYIEYRILPLFDLLHWHEVFSKEVPRTSILEENTFDDLPLHKRRYKAHDSKKLHRRAMLECDTLKYMYSE